MWLCVCVSNVYAHVGPMYKACCLLSRLSVSLYTCICLSPQYIYLICVICLSGPYHIIWVLFVWIVKHLSLGYIETGHFSVPKCMYNSTPEITSQDTFFCPRLERFHSPSSILPIGRAGASPPSRSAGQNFPYIYMYIYISGQPSHTVNVLRASFYA